ncbi:transcription-repair coupling factor [bacterium]|jgi:transcription-repair coupling factor|nr:transcription-repair coupling factor [bacterium]MBT6293457.1 transcription-repair coupling factor [bacterium]
MTKFLFSKNTFKRFNHQFLDLVCKNKISKLSGFPNKTAKAFFIANSFYECNFDKLIFAVNERSQLDTFQELLHNFGVKHVQNFRILDNPHNDAGIVRKNLISKLNFAANLQSSKKEIVLITIQELLSYFPNKKQVERNKLNFKVGQKISMIEVFESLIKSGYDNGQTFHVFQGEYYAKGEQIMVFPFNSDFPVCINVAFDEITEIKVMDLSYEKEIGSFEEVEIWSFEKEDDECFFSDFMTKHSLLIQDELDVFEDQFKLVKKFEENLEPASSLFLQAFNEDEDNHLHVRKSSILQYQSLEDFTSDIILKKQSSWSILLFTKKFKEIKGILDSKNIVFYRDVEALQKQKHGVLVVDMMEDSKYFESFMSTDQKFLILSDKDIPGVVKNKKKNKNNHQVYLDLMTQLKPNDLVVHADHGVGRFEGLVSKVIADITKEFMEVSYAQNDKLFVPIDQAERVSKYIGNPDLAPKLTRLGGSEWQTVSSKLKKETEKIAKELLALYAQRKAAKGFKYSDDKDAQSRFEETFPYEETPGQIKAILDVKKDMENDQPMDRLVCGDVGFGKTEVAMRAAFKAVTNQKQVAFISPITILADQHYKSFKKRMDDFDVRVEMLSRFKTPSEQRKILERTAKGEVDILIGTHRLISPDVKFKNLGLVMIDEEQRFGVKQKEKLKEFRAEVDVLTLTATPIPRTLNICLNKLRDITTITTPPPGRLPVVTEVRKYSEKIIKEAVEKEIARNGQAYILHNRVQTIDTFAERLKSIMPGIRFIVAHGKLSPLELEDRIMSFKKGEADVLISSTIIENGIDLANANTLIVNKAEQFGLSQLYQLRGRVGRSKTQAYAYLLYHGQRLKLDAKKRLKAIVEASELGSGFQIAMKDLEIRGAGEILGSSQSGAMNVVGVAHFLRMLNKAVEELESGVTQETQEIKDVSIELPINAFIPSTYISSSKEKVSIYQKLSSADSLDYLQEIQTDVIEEFGALPAEVLNLFSIIELKIYAKKANLINIKTQNMSNARLGKQVVLSISKNVKPENIMNMLSKNPKWQISSDKLKIFMSDLGVNFLPTLIESVKALAVKFEVKAKK